MFDMKVDQNLAVIKTLGGLVDSDIPVEEWADVQLVYKYTATTAKTFQL